MKKIKLKKCVTSERLGEILEEATNYEEFSLVSDRTVCAMLEGMPNSDVTSQSKKNLKEGCCTYLALRTFPEKGNQYLNYFPGLAIEFPKIRGEENYSSVDCQPMLGKYPFIDNPVKVKELGEFRPFFDKLIGKIIELSDN